VSRKIVRIFPVWFAGKQSHLHVDFSDGTKLIAQKNESNSQWKVGDVIEETKHGLHPPADPKPAG
jgi:hypothetical protein